MQDWKYKTIEQAIADGEGTVTLHFGKQKYFKIDNEQHQTDHYGDWEFQLDSFFVTETLGFLDLEGTVEAVITKANDYLLEHELVTFTIQGYINGEATDIALLPKEALPDRLEEAEYDEEQDAFIAPKVLFDYIFANRKSCSIHRVEA
jgi:hypothetical protein